MATVLDGVRVVDISDPTQPKEIGHYVLNEAAIWDVAEHEGLVLARDDKDGLWIFRDAP